MICLLQRLNLKMTEQGVVIKLDGSFAVCRIGRNSACASCGKCGMTEKQKHVDFYVENTLNAKVGDTVTLNIPDASSARLAFFAYCVPLAPALAGLFACLALGGKDWLAILVFFVGLAVGFAAVAWLDRRHKHHWTKCPTMQGFVVNDGAASVEPNE